MRTYLLSALLILLASPLQASELTAVDTQRFIDDLIANPPSPEQLALTKAMFTADPRYIDVTPGQYRHVIELAAGIPIGYRGVGKNSTDMEEFD